MEKKKIKGLIERYSLDKAKLAKIIDHTLLKPEASEKDIIKLCKEAEKYHFGAVCINPWYVKLAHNTLEGTGVNVCTVVGFPLGLSTAKSYEAAQAVKDGAEEIDMVINIGALKSKKYLQAQKDISSVVKSSHEKTVKVILETCLLSKAEITKGCHLAMKAGAHYVKTSTGFSKEGATIENVKLMRMVVGSEMGIKAAGGIKTLETALAMIEVGAPKNNLEYLFRIGTSSGVQLIEELRGYL